MSTALNDRLHQLRGTKCSRVESLEYEERPADPAYSVGTVVTFSDSTRLSLQFWRLIKNGKPLVSIFDHQQKYGLPAPIDAIAMLKNELPDRTIVDAEMDETTGDLRFQFEGDVRFEVFNFTAFEIWELTFADGTGEYSNYALQA